MGRIRTDLKKSVFCSSVLFAWLISGICVANEYPKNVNAGVVAYACNGDGAQYLLAYDPAEGRKGWGAFGGRPKQDERADQTALREFWEETNCVFEQSELAESDLIGPSDFNGYFSFAIQVSYHAPDQISQIRQCQNIERLRWLWVAHRQLISALEDRSDQPVLESSAPKSFQLHLWPGAAGSLRKALDDGIIQFQDPCQ